MREQYISHLRLKGYSARTINQYKSVYDRFQKWLNNQLLWNEVPRMQELNIDQVRDYLHSKRYELQTFYGIKSIFEWLFIDDFVEENICWRLDSPVRRITYPDFLEVGEIDELLSVADTRERTVIHLMFATGMRVGEVAQVKESDLMLHSGMIKIHGKGNKERMGLLYPDAIKHMEKWITIRNRAKLKTFWGTHPQKIFVELRPKIMNEALKAKMARPHILRHSFATHMVRGGADIMVVKDLLGHEHVRDTEKYVHISGQQIREAINLVFNKPREKSKPTKFMTRKEITAARRALK